MMLRAVISAVIVVAVATAACERSKSPTQPTTTVAASSFSISGEIREKLPDGTSGLSIVGARVEVVGKLGVVSFTTSDNAGRYDIGDVGGTFDLRVSKDGYETNTLRVGPLRENLTFDAAIAPIVRTLVGIVTETPPTETTPIGGAKIAIVSGSNKGQSVTTDGNGYFSMAGVWGDFDVSVSRGGYEARTVHASVNEPVNRLDVRLMPDDQPMESVFTRNLCTVADPPPGGGVSWAGVSPDFRCVHQTPLYATQIHHWLPVHRPGIMTVAADYIYHGDYYENFLSFEVRCGGQLIASKKVEKGGGWPRPPVWLPDGTATVQIALPQACEYEVKLFNYLADVKGGDWTTYRVELKHPK